MSEWWTYSLSDFLLFSPHTYYRLFELHNLAVWPAPVVSMALGVAILALSRSGGGWRGRVAAALLVGCWLWVAWAFHLRRYASINWAAAWFAAGFALEAALLAWAGVVRGQLFAEPVRNRIAAIGIALACFALIGQPLIGPSLGRGWAAIEVFGVAPDPTATATLGLLLAATARVRWLLLLIPLAWCAISGATLWAMQAPDAWVTPLVGLLVLVVSAWQTRALHRRRMAA